MKIPFPILALFASALLSTNAVGATITAVEYYFDTDPGPGNGAVVSVANPASLISMQVQVPPSAIQNLSPGTHIFICRVKDDAGNWSVALARPLVKLAEDATLLTPSPIVAAEYYFDTDPGPGAGNRVTITPGGSPITAAINVPPAIIGALRDGQRSLICRVQDQAGNWSVAASRTFSKETVPDVEPTITQNPVSQTVNPGSPVTFTVLATGTEPFSYQWKHGSINIPNANSSSFTIQSVQAADAGTYSVVVSNSAGSATSSPATLSVNVPPSITTQPITQTVRSGSSATFTVIASGTPPFTYQWKKDGQDLPGQTGASLVLSGANAGSVGRYSVVIRNVAGEISSQMASLSLIDIQMYPGLTIYGQVGTRYKVEYANQADATAWTSLAEVILPESPYTFSDYNAPRGYRFYRATLVP